VIVALEAAAIAFASALVIAVLVPYRASRSFRERTRYVAAIASIFGLAFALAILSALR
jgi:hypothetical protein